MLFQLAAIAIAVNGMDILKVGLLGLTAFSSLNLSPEFYMEANVLCSTGRRPKSYRTECRAVFFSIIYPETAKLIYKEILDEGIYF